MRNLAKCLQKVVDYGGPYFEVFVAFVVNFRKQRNNNLIFTNFPESFAQTTITMYSLKHIILLSGTMKA